VIGGQDCDAIEAVKELYRGIEAPCITTDITSAEMIKYAANAFLATKISFINEIAMLCDRIDASVDDVVKGISLDPRIGSSFLRPGVGYGGSCFPKDVGSLDHTALANGHSFELLRSVIAVNNRQRLLPLQALRKQFGRLLGVPIGVLGLAFKPHTDDVREAPAIDLVRHLCDEGALVKAHDPKANGKASRIVPASVALEDSLLSCADDVQALVLGADDGMA
jgi:UDPglucose 6-dehydrogenase